jgi:nucleoside-diphosphate-sugar epimerase
MGGVVITGAGGYLGRLLAERWLAENTNPTLWLHARNRQELVAQQRDLPPSLASLPVVGGDLVSDQPFCSLDPAAVKVIVHAAAVTRFNVEADLAEAINVEGTRKLLEFAERCPNLEKVVLLSTLYVAGLDSGVIPEQPLGRPGAFANHYEGSKWAAERLLVDEFNHLPWQIHRVATVIADTPNGPVGQFNAVHNTLRLLHHGLLPVLPGCADTPIPFVTGDYAASASVSVTRNVRAGEVVHLGQRAMDTLPLGELLDVAYSVSTETGRRPLRVPLVSLADFELLTSASEGLAGEVLGCAIDSVSPFAPQLFCPKRFETEAVAGVHEPFAVEPRALIASACREVLR